MKDIKIIDDLDYRETDVSLEYLNEEEIEEMMDLDDTIDCSKLFSEVNKNGD
ncbi:MAG: hypothetical protein ACI4WU_05260 [Bacilli bacterium]